MSIPRLKDPFKLRVLSLFMVLILRSAPLPIDSDAESAVEDNEQPKNEEPTDSKMKDDDEEDDAGEPEEYVVESILDHHSDFEDVSRFWSIRVHNPPANFRLAGSSAISCEMAGV